MSKLYSLILLGFLSLTLLIAQDSTDLKTHYQKQLFQRINDSLEYSALEVMLSLDYSEGIKSEVEAELNNIYLSLEPEKLKSKKTKKIIKKLYKHVHDRNLKKYIETATFTQIFEKGEYNCVSASALYALLLDRFEIDYEIRETPNHVYLVADPKNEKILIETTTPQNGTIEYDYKTQKDYVKYLRENKLISEKEYESNPVEELFNKYFDSNKIISLKELAALLYYNKGVERYNESEFAKAAEFITKTYQIYPSANIHFMANMALVNALAKCEAKKEYNPYLLAQLINLNETETAYSESGYGHFTLVGDELMVRHPDPEKYLKFYKTLKANVHDSFKLTPYKQDYYWRLSYLRYTQQQLPKSLKALEITYNLNPENLEVQDRVLAIASEHMMNDINHKENIDSLNHYFEVFPFLKENNTVMNYYHYAEIRVAREAFIAGDLKSGLPRLKKMEEKIKNQPNLIYDENYMAQAYLDLAAYYMRQENVNQIAKSIKRGLAILPNSLLLQNRYRSVQRMTSDWNQRQEIIQHYQKQEKESFKDKFERYFVSCWEISGSRKDNKESNYDPNFKIFSYDDNEVRYELNGKSEKGTYSIRSKSRLLYLIPNRDKDDYIMYKVESIDDVYMTLAPLKGKYLSGEKVYMRKCQ